MDADNTDLLLTILAAVTGTVLVALIVTGYVILWRQKQRLQQRVHIMLEDIKTILKSHAILQDQYSDHHTIVQNRLNANIKELEKRFYELYPDAAAIEFSASADEEVRTLALRHHLLQAEITFSEYMQRQPAQGNGQKLPAGDSAAWADYRELAATLRNTSAAQEEDAAKYIWSNLRSASEDFRQLTQLTEEQVGYVDDLHDQLQKARAGDISEESLRQYRRQVRHLLDGYAQSDEVIVAVGRCLHNYEMEIDQLEQQINKLSAQQSGSAETAPDVPALDKPAPHNPAPEPATATTASQQSQSDGELELNDHITRLVDENNKLRVQLEKLRNGVQMTQSTVSSG